MTSPFLALEVVGLAVTPVDSPGFKEGSVGAAVWPESLRKKGKNRHPCGPYLAACSSFGVVVIDAIFVGCGVAEGGLGFIGVVSVWENLRCSEWFLRPGWAWSTEKERGSPGLGARLTFAALTLFAKPELSNPGAVFSGVANCENCLGPSPPTTPDISGLGRELEGVGTSSLNGTGGVWPWLETFEEVGELQDPFLYRILKLAKNRPTRVPAFG